MSLQSISMPSFNPETSTENFIPNLGNRYLRFGQHPEVETNRGSLNGSNGSLWGPEVYDPWSEEWMKGTLDHKNLAIALGVGGDNADLWNLTGSPEELNSYWNDAEASLPGSFNSDNSTLFDARTEGANFFVDDSGLQSGNDGSYGSFIWRGYYTLSNNGYDVNISLTRKYEFGEDDKYIKETTTVQNLDNKFLNNVRLWIGVGDDYVGDEDANDKIKGNIVNGEFIPISSDDGVRYLNDNQDIQAKAALNGEELPGVSIDLDEEGSNVPVNILYTPNDNGYAIIAEDYDWDGFDDSDDPIGSNPLASDSVLPGQDGGYAIYYKIGNLAPGKSASVDTYFGISFVEDFDEDFKDISNASRRKLIHLPISLIDEDEPNEITGNSSNNFLLGARSRDVMKGGSGNDFLKARDNNDILIGGSGNDSLYGGKDNDELIGGSGNDTLGGGKGDDILTGGSNADTFKISKGNDVIRDFSIAQNDRIDANGYDLEFTQDGSSLLISDADNDVLTTVLNLNRDDLLTWQPELVG